MNTESTFEKQMKNKRFKFLFFFEYLKLSINEKVLELMQSVGNFLIDLKSQNELFSECRRNFKNIILGKWRHLRFYLKKTNTSEQDHEGKVKVLI